MCAAGGGKCPALSLRPLPTSCLFVLCVFVPACCRCVPLYHCGHCQLLCFVLFVFGPARVQWGGKCPALSLRPLPTLCLFVLCCVSLGLRIASGVPLYHCGHCRLHVMFCLCCVSLGCACGSVPVYHCGDCRAAILPLILQTVCELQRVEAKASIFVGSKQRERRARRNVGGCVTTLSWAV